MRWLGPTLLLAAGCGPLSLGAVDELDLDAIAFPASGADPQSRLQLDIRFGYRRTATASCPPLEPFAFTCNGADAERIDVEESSSQSILGSSCGHVHVLRCEAEAGDAPSLALVAVGESGDEIRMDTEDVFAPRSLGVDTDARYRAGDTVPFDWSPAEDRTDDGELVIEYLQSGAAIGQERLVFDVDQLTLPEAAAPGPLDVAGVLFVSYHVDNAGIGAENDPRAACTGPLCRVSLETRAEATLTLEAAP